MTYAISELEKKIAILKFTIENGYAEGNSEAELAQMEEQLLNAHPETPVDAPVATIKDTKTTPVDDKVEDDESSEEQLKQPEGSIETPETWSVDTVQADVDIAEQFTESYAVVENQLPEFTYEKYKKFFVLAAKATCLSKWTGAFKLPIRCTAQNPLPARLAQTFGLLSFDYYKADALINKAIKDTQLATPYLTICSVPTKDPRDTKVANHEKVKSGCHFIAHWDTFKLVEKDYLLLGHFENLFKDENLKNDEYHTHTTEIMGVRYKQQVWLEGNKQIIADLIKNLETVCPKEVNKATYKAWSGILALALLWDQVIYKEMRDLMIEMAGTNPLEGKYKLACALSVVVPEIESFFDRFKNNKDMQVSTTMIDGLLKSVGFTEGSSICFQDIALAKAKYRSGYTIQLLKDTYTPLLNFEDVRIQRYLKTLKRPEASNILNQPVA
ncbi:hypothetical protein FW754_15385 [Acinetobacter sp. 1207_04]|uniref:hypothetical protein n=1 Tax=Acinetobacter sp. 1207_04 TaxID=2604449 RepID=UPI004059655A